MRALRISFCASFFVISLFVFADNTTEKGTAMSTEKFVNIRLLDENNTATTAVEMRKVVKTDAEWLSQIGDERFAVARSKGTERPFCGVFHDNKKKGFYACVCCGLPLFRSDDKFDSGTGWPSFLRPFADENVATAEDASHGMKRTEINCALCDAHLGHVFNDGPPPTGQRHCVNSASLEFVPLDEKERVVSSECPARVLAVHAATFAAGCFWGVEAAFRKAPGVVATAVGYTGGTTPNATYKQVCSGTTGHAEAVEVFFDPAVTSFEKLLELFWSIHDPTTRNRQGPDIGTQYRSAIFYHGAAQKAAAQASKEKLEASGKFKGPVVTEITPAAAFNRAEDYHQRYVEKKGLPACH